ncbi:zinc finger protein 420-like [Hyperolius riggenbachi]|uniref:zinc finger protein 420-like n=1 Tax=Hyperolius riggenbachi TaxID=752182 RepID=UPI0035A2ABC9
MGEEQASFKLNASKADALGPLQSDANLYMENHQDFQRMDKEKSQITEKILSLVLDILYLLIEEDYIIVKESGGHVKYCSTTQRPTGESSPHSQGTNNQKILEVTNKIIELLAGEEWEYVQDHNELEKGLDVVDVFKKNQQPLVQAMPSASRTESKPFIQSSIPLYIRKDRGIITVSPQDASYELLPEDSKPTVITATASPSEGVKLPEIYIHIPTDQLDYVPVPNNCTSYIPESFPSRDMCKPVGCGGETAASPAGCKQVHTDFSPVKIKEESRDWKQEGFGTQLKQEKRQHLSRRSESNVASYTNRVIGADDILESYSSGHLKPEPDLCVEEQLTRSGIASPSYYSQLPENPDFHSEENFPYSSGVHDGGNLQGQYMSCSIKKEPEDVEINEDTYREEEEEEEETNEAMSPASSFQRTHAEELSYEYYLSQSSNAQPDMDNPEKPFSCSECGKCFKYSNLLMHHAKSHQKKPLICCDCGKQYSCKTEFEIHVRIHTGEKPFVCSECGKGFRRKSHMLRHRRIHGDKQLFPCPECAKCFHRLDVLNQHRKIHRANRSSPDMESLHARALENSPTNSLDELQTQNAPMAYEEKVGFVCPDCDKCFHSLAALNQHRKMHQVSSVSSDVEDPSNMDHTQMDNLDDEENENPSTSYEEKIGFACSECGKCYDEMSQLERHQRVHMGEKPFSCTECGKSFRFEALLELHWGSHITTISCPECGKTFASQSLLNHHLKIHAGANECICSECGKDFPSRSQLVDHYRTHTGEKPYMCPDCGKFFRRKAHVVRHRKIHKGNKPYSCLECGKCFESQEFLSRHSKMHRRKRPHSCSQCSKSYTKKSHLVRHQRTHAKETPYTCNECGECFQYPALLTQHLKRHTGQTNFNCVVCGRSFGSNAALCKHRKVHSKEKSFICVECGKSFVFYSHFMRHQVSHSGDKPFVCPECGKRFTRESHLVRHKRAHNGGRALEA